MSERMTPEQIAEVVSLHEKWLRGESGGLRANLSGCDLSGCNLRRSNLSGCDLRGCDLSGCDLRGSNLSGCDLRGCDLSGCDLSDCNLSGSNLRRSNLRRSNLSGCDLSGCDLSGSNLRGCDLRGCDLRGCDLSDCNLSGSNLRRSNLSGCDLRGCDLSGCDLSGCDLTPIRDDLWAVLCATPAEVPGLRLALVEGRVDGSTYTGNCACLVGTLANKRHCEYSAIPNLKPDSTRPAEVWFLNIKEGDTPETNQFSALTLEWVDQWLVNMRAAFTQNAAG